MRRKVLIFPRKIDPGVLAEFFDEVVSRGFPLRFHVEAGIGRLGQKLADGAKGIPGIGQIVDLFKPDECANYFSSCGYDPA